MTEFNNTMDMVNNQLDEELCDKLSNPTYLTEFTSVTHYDNIKNMLYILASDFENESFNNFDYTSYANYLYTLDGYINIDDIRLDEPIFVLEYNGEILNADVDYFNIIFSTGFKDSLNKDGKQVLQDYEKLTDLLTQFEDDKDMDTLEMIRAYDYNWYTVDDLAELLEKYAEE